MHMARMMSKTGKMWVCKYLWSFTLPDALMGKNQLGSLVHSGFSNEQAQFIPFVNSSSLMTSLFPASQIQVPPRPFSKELHRPSASGLHTVISIPNGRGHWKATERVYVQGRLETRSLGQIPAVFLPLYLCAPRRHTWYNYHCPPFFPRSLASCY